LVAVNTGSAATFAARSHRQGAAVGREGYGFTEFVPGVGIRSLEISNRPYQLVYRYFNLGRFAATTFITGRQLVASVDFVGQEDLELIAAGICRNTGYLNEVARAVFVFEQLVAGLALDVDPAKVEHLDRLIIEVQGWGWRLGFASSTRSQHR